MSETIRITPRSGWVGLELAELWRYRPLLLIFAWRDVRARYKQALAGITWVVLQPVLTMVVFTLFFGRWLGLSSGETPYAVFTFAALIPWTFFVHALTVGTNSIVGNAEIVTKVFFPRLILPMACVVGSLVDLGMSLLVLVPIMLWYQQMPGIELLALPLFVIVAALAALSVSVWLAALNVRYRDVSQAMPFVSQLWLFLTPVAYPISVVPTDLRPLYELNPMVAVVQGFRWSLVGGDAPSARMLLTGGAGIAVLLVLGLYWFRRQETTFADVV